MKRNKKNLLFIFVFMFLLISPSYGEIYPKLIKPVTDYDGALKQEDKDDILFKIEELEREHSIQLRVVTIKSLKDYVSYSSIDVFAADLLKKWEKEKIVTGRSVLLLYSGRDRKVRIQIGSMIDPSVVASMENIIATEMIPLFKQYHSSEGIKVGVRKIILVLTGQATPIPGVVPVICPDAADKAYRPVIDNMFRFFLFLIIICFMVFLLKGNVNLDGSHPGKHKYYNRHSYRGSSSRRTGRTWSGGGGASGSW